MAMVTIDPVRLRGAVQRLESARTAAAGAADALVRAADEAEADCLAATRFGSLGRETAWVDEAVRYLNVRIGYADMMLEDQPGEWATTFDDARITDLGDTATRAWASQLAAWIEDYVAGPSAAGLAELADRLAARAWDPYCAQALAAAVGPSVLAGFLDRVQQSRAQLVDWVRQRGAVDPVGDPDSSPELSAFDEADEALLAGLGDMWSLASRGQGALAAPGLKASWVATVDAEGRYFQNRTRAARLPFSQTVELTQVMARGRWSTSFIDAMAAAVRRAESPVEAGDVPADLWRNQFDRLPVDPGQRGDQGETTWVDDAMTGLWRSMMADPGAVLDRYAAGGTVELPAPGGATVRVDADLWAELFERGSSESSLSELAWLLYVAGAIGDPALAARQNALRTQFAALDPALQGQIELADQEWERQKPHLVADAIGLVLDCVDAVQALWYALEGDTDNATVSAIAAVPLAGIIGWLAKQGKHAIAAGRLTGDFGKLHTRIASRRPGIRPRVSTQRQARHVFGTMEYQTYSKGGSYFLKPDDAQAVLNAFNRGDAAVLGAKKTGEIVIEVPSVTGYYVNSKYDVVSTPTHVFFIKGTTSPSIVPYNPNFKWHP
ncbi:MAG: hypothetical protein LBH76_08695 [Propionibacteriaceae bacterium]|jgi:hypothetical protein|nr:hypothetical protein [Propionibacteriaceae bacterium]